jgi:hypothetical protein
LPIYDGVVTLDDQIIPVMIEVDEEHVRLSASGTEIGEWPAAECLISHLGDSAYSITAENETLTFVPNQPALFAAAVNGTSGHHVAMPPEPPSPPLAKDGVQEAPPPQPLTVGLFYALCVLTVALGLWALASILI